MISGVKSSVGVKIYRTIGVGSKITISISKMRNKTANKKNRSENGIRALVSGVNPHSKDLEVSRKFHDFGDRFIIENLTKRIIGIIIAKSRGINRVIM